MRMLVRSAATIPEGVADLAKRRLAFALGRFHDRVASMTVRLRDLNGPKGGVDQQCVVAIRLTTPRREIVAEGTDATPEVAVSLAVDRAARAVARAVRATRRWHTADLGVRG